MTKEEMHRYWLTEEWAKIKCDLIAEHGFKCQWCGKETELLAVHHLTYENLGCEEQGDLVLICNGCHMKEHGIKQKKAKSSKPHTTLPPKKSVKRTLSYYRRVLMSRFRYSIKGCHGWVDLANKTAEFYGEAWKGKGRSQAKKYVKRRLS